jgi:hypothetical protein
MLPNSRHTCHDAYSVTVFAVTLTNNSPLSKLWNYLVGFVSQLQTGLFAAEDLGWLNPEAMSVRERPHPELNPMSAVQWQEQEEDFIITPLC